MINNIIYHNEGAFLLRNSLVETIVLPKHGGKLSSLKFVPKDFELLFQNPKTLYQKAYAYEPFEKFEACGLDDAFPTIDPCSIHLGEKTVLLPDHGEVWTTEMEAKINGESLVLSFDSTILPCHYEKRISMLPDGVMIQYCITSCGEEAFPYLWVLHMLVALRKEMKLIMPPDSSGQKKTVFQAPGMEKWYLEEPVRVGLCGFEFPKEKLKASICYDADKLPYLGFWKTEGGFRGDYNCALEPATGYYDNVCTALKNGRCTVLEPGQTEKFSISIRFQT